VEWAIAARESRKALAAPTDPGVTTDPASDPAGAAWLAARRAATETTKIGTAQSTAQRQREGGDDGASQSSGAIEDRSVGHDAISARPMDFSRVYPTYVRIIHH